MLAVHLPEYLKTLKSSGTAMPMRMHERERERVKENTLLKNCKASESGLPLILRLSSTLAKAYIQYMQASKYACVPAVVDAWARPRGFSKRGVNFRKTMLLTKRSPFGGSNVVRANKNLDIQELKRVSSIPAFFPCACNHRRRFATHIRKPFAVLEKAVENSDS